MTDVVAGVLLLLGASFLLLAGVALVRMPDLFMRISSSSKAVSLGAGVMFLAAGAYFAETGVLARAIAGMGFFLLTSPVAAHVMARAGHHIGIPYWRGTLNVPPHEDRTPGADDREFH